jgi:hypothetical protein
MKKHFLHLNVIAIAILFMSSPQAHDASEHKGNIAKPNCDAMKDMDHSNVDKTDPIMLAMMKKCMAEKQHHESSSDSHAGEKKQKEHPEKHKETEDSQEKHNH